MTGSRPSPDTEKRARPRDSRGWFVPYPDVVEDWRDSPMAVSSSGYRKVFVGRKHPMAFANGQAYVHRLVMAEKLGRPLFRGEVVHHIDGNRLNNDPDNLEVFASQSAHMGHHSEQIGIPNSQVRELLLAGHSTSEIVAMGPITERRVTRIRRELVAEGYRMRKQGEKRRRAA